MLKKKWFVLLIVALVLLLAACSGGAAQPEKPAESAPAQEKPAESAPAASESSAQSSTATGGTVRVGWGGAPDTLNPATAVVAESYTLFNLVYDTLVNVQLDGKYIPNLADSWQVSDDGKTYTFKIHAGVKFHDGQPLTAKDVAFSYNFYHDHEDFVFLNSYTEPFESIEATDDTTVVVKLTEAVPSIEYYASSLYILPEHIWSKHSEGKAATEYENPELIGSGPFKLAEYKQNESVRLEANKDHFLYPPHVDTVTFQTFANQDALVQALQTGQVDMITEMPKTAVPVLRNAENIQLVIKPPKQPHISDVFFNQVTPENCPKDAGGKCTGHPALLDRNIRLALAHATDKKNIIEVVILGLGNPGLTLLPDGLGDWYNNSLQDYEFDIDKANKILDDAGYKDKDGDGVRETPDGSKSLIFRVNWPNDSAESPRMADLLSQNWAKIGVKTEPQALDSDTLTTACCPGFDYDIILWGWYADEDPQTMLRVMTTQDIPNGNNETGYSNPEFDKLFDQQIAELNRDKRKEIVWQLQKIAHDDVVYIIPYYDQNVQAFRSDRFTGWVTDQPRMELENPSSLTAVRPVQ